MEFDLTVDLSAIFQGLIFTTLVWYHRTINKLLETAALHGWRLESIEKKIG